MNNWYHVHVGNSVLIVLSLKTYVPFRKSSGLHVCPTWSKYRDDIVIKHYNILNWRWNSFQNVYFLFFLANVKLCYTKTSWLDELSVSTRRLCKCRRRENKWQCSIKIEALNWTVAIFIKMQTCLYPYTVFASRL